MGSGTSKPIEKSCTSIPKEKTSKWDAYLRLLEPFRMGERPLNDETRKKALQKLCRFGKDYMIAESLEFHFKLRDHASDLLNDSIVDILIKGNKWLTLEKLFSGKKWLTHEDLLEIAKKKTVSKDHDEDEIERNTRRRIVVEAMRAVQNLSWIINPGPEQNVETWQINTHENAGNILLHCFDDQLEEVVRLLMQNNLWFTLTKLLVYTKRTISDELRRLTVEKAVDFTACYFANRKYYSLQYHAWEILQICTDDQVPNVLKHLTRMHRWWDLKSFFESRESCIDTELREWVVSTACQEAEDCEAAKYVLPRCTDGQLDMVVKTLVRWKNWTVLGQFMRERDLSESQRRLIVNKAREEVDDDKAGLEVFPLCRDEVQLMSLIPQLVQECRWSVLSTMMIQGDSMCRHHVLAWMQQNADETTMDAVIRHNSKNSHFRFFFPPDSSAMERSVPRIVKLLVERNWWRSLQCFTSYSEIFLTNHWKSFIIDKALESNDDYAIKQFLKFAPESWREDLIDTLVSRGKWKAVCQLLPKPSMYQYQGQADTDDLRELKESLLQEFFAHCHIGEDKTVKYKREENNQGLMQISAEDMVKSKAKIVPNEVELIARTLLALVEVPVLESWIEKLVELRFWTCLDYTLTKGISQEKKQRILVEARQQISTEDNVHALEVFTKHCSDQMVEEALRLSVQHKNWDSVSTLFKRNVSDSVRAWVNEEITKQVPSYAADYILRNVSLNYSQQQIVEDFFMSAEQGIGLLEWEKKLLNSLGWDKELYRVLSLSFKKLSPSAQSRKMVVQRENEHQTGSTVSDSPSDQSGSGTVTDAAQTDSTTSRFLSVVDDVLTLVKNCSTTCRKDKTMVPYDKTTAWTKQLEMVDTHSIDARAALKRLVLDYHTGRNKDSDKVLLRVLAMVPLLPRVQDVVLDHMLQKNRWKVIFYANLTRVSETMRRRLLDVAVQRCQWTVVKKMSDHSLYDDQRGATMEAACRAKQWNAYLHLSQHSLKEHEMLHVLYKVINNINSDDSQDWSIVLDALERCADVRDLKHMLDPWDMKTATRDPQASPRRQRTAVRLQELEERLRRECSQFSTAARKKNWAAVLYMLSRHLEVLAASHRSTVTSARADSEPVHDIEESSDAAAKLDSMIVRIIEVALAARAWHVVSRLLKMGTSQEYRDSLLPRMLDSGQWGVCRTLLERGVSGETCLNSVPVLLQHCQWILLARVMEHDAVKDETRKRIVFHAVRRGEGSVVWHGLQIMTTPLTEAEREDLFNLALQYDAWQALRPLVEIKDSMGVKQRDEACVKAVDQHQWDVVDHCQRYHANINQLVSLAKKAAARDWEAVEELAQRDADVSVTMDTYDKQTALHFAVSDKQWKTTKILIQYHSKLNAKTVSGRTPMQGIIKARQGGLIDCALFWSPDVPSGRSKDLETPLHAACIAGWRHTMYYLVMRGCDPLAVTKHGESVLDCAVKLLEGAEPDEEAIRRQKKREHFQGKGKNKKRDKAKSAVTLPEGAELDKKMLGSQKKRERFQGKLTEQKPDKAKNEEQAALLKARTQAKAQRMLASCIRLGFSTYQPALTRRSETNDTRSRRPRYISSMRRAIQHNSVVLMKMLYESGACSHRELCNLETWPDHNLQEVRDALTDMQNTPRPLQSACRLVVSRCLDVRGRRHKEVLNLPKDQLEDRARNCKISLRDYVMFADITEPYLNISHPT